MLAQCLLCSCVYDSAARQFYDITNVRFFPNLRGGPPRTRAEADGLRQVSTQHGPALAGLVVRAARPVEGCSSEPLTTSSCCPGGCKYCLASYIEGPDTPLVFSRHVFP